MGLIGPEKGGEERRTSVSGGGRLDDEAAVSGGGAGYERVRGSYEGVGTGTGNRPEANGAGRGLGELETIDVDELAQLGPAGEDGVGISVREGDVGGVGGVG